MAGSDGPTNSERESAPSETQADSCAPDRIRAAASSHVQPASAASPVPACRSPVARRSPAAGRVPARRPGCSRRRAASSTSAHRSAARAWSSSVVGRVRHARCGTPPATASTNAGCRSKRSRLPRSVTGLPGVGELPVDEPGHREPVSGSTSRFLGLRSLCTRQARPDGRAGPGPARRPPAGRSQSCRGPCRQCARPPVRRRPRQAGPAPRRAAARTRRSAVDEHARPRHRHLRQPGQQPAEPVADRARPVVVEARQQQVEPLAAGGGMVTSRPGSPAPGPRGVPPAPRAPAPGRAPARAPRRPPPAPPARGGAAAGVDPDHGPLPRHLGQECLAAVAARRAASRSVPIMSMPGILPQRDGPTRLRQHERPGGAEPVRRPSPRPRRRRPTGSDWDAYADEYQATHGAFLGDVGFLWGPEGVHEADLGVLGDVAGTRRAGDRLRGRAVRALAAGRRAPAPSASTCRRRQLQHSRRIDDETGARVPSVLRHGDRTCPSPTRSFDVVFSAFGALQFVARRRRRPSRRWPGCCAPAAASRSPSPTRCGGACRTTRPGGAGGDQLLLGPHAVRRAGRRDGRARYVEHHRTLGDWVRLLRRRRVRASTDLHEPEWPEGHDRVWGGWGPVAGCPDPRHRDLRAPTLGLTPAPSTDAGGAPVARRPFSFATGTAPASDRAGGGARTPRLRPPAPRGHRRRGPGCGRPRRPRP